MIFPIPHRWSVLLGAATVMLASLPGAQAQLPGSGPRIQPMTVIGPDGSGYLTDPQPIHLAHGSGPVQLLSGTTRAVIRCAYPLRPGCFDWRRLTIDAGALSTQIAAAGATVTNFQNIDIFQDDRGGWHAAVTIGVRSPLRAQHWTVVAHAHPRQPGAAGEAPLDWAADTVLAGSFTRAEDGNYDGKYVEDDGRLFLLYVRNTHPRPAIRNVIVLQPMRSPTEASGPAVELLATGDRYGDLASEQYANTQAKLVEAPYLAHIGTKYALIYSTGGYLTPGYKAAVAWSDTIFPKPGEHYRKVLERDEAGIWGRPGGWEVHYLIQSARPRWPNFTGATVIGPGVASAVQGPQGAWWLFFNGFAPNDMPRGQNGQVDGGHRRPFYMRLNAAVPPDRSVASVSDAELSTWLTPARD